MIRKNECPPLFSEHDYEDYSVKCKTPTKQVTTPQKTIVCPEPREVVDSPINTQSNVPINKDLVTTSRGRVIKPPSRLNL